MNEVYIPLWDVVTPYLIEAVAVIIAIGFSWAVKKFNDWTGIQIEAKHRDALQTALGNAANLALLKAIPKGGVTVQVESLNMQAAIKYVTDGVPDAIRYFDLTPERIAEMVRAKVLPAAKD